MYQASTFYNQFKEVKNFLDNNGQITLFDRAFIGEYPWSIYYKRTDRIYDEYYVINKIFNSELFKALSYKIFVVFLYAEPEILTQRILESMEDNSIYTNYNYRDIQKNIEYMKRLYKDLEGICIKNNLEILSLNSNTEDDIDRNVYQILKEMKY